MRKMPYRRVGGTALLFAVLTSPLLVHAAPQNAPASPGVIQSYDSYKSWFVACDNGLHCIAKGFSETYQGAEIDVDRNAGPSGRLSLSIRADRKFSLRDIRIDGKSVGLSAAAWKVDTSEDSTTVSSDDLPAIRQIAARLRDASKVTLGGDAEVSLDGFAAAILRLDDRQGRVGGVTAIARYGPLPASRVPDAPQLPRIPNRPISATLSQGEAERLIAAVRADQKAVFAKEDCEADTMSMEPEAYALDERQALVLIPCIMGAYQGSSLGFIASRAGGHARQLIAPTPYQGNDPDRSDASDFTNDDFDPKTGTLSMFAKGRGLADCGMSASWIWNGEAFVLSEMTLQQACGGIEPGDWPTIFKSIRR